MKHKNWIALSGFIWLLIGSFLLYKGLHFISDAILQESSLCYRWKDFFGSAEQAGIFLMAAALFLGFLKGRFVLSKTAHRVVNRISSLSLPIRFSDVYPNSYWILIGSMIFLGISLRFLPIPIDVRGFIDITVGSALLNGSTLYFRFARRYA